MSERPTICRHQAIVSFESHSQTRPAYLCSFVFAQLQQWLSLSTKLQPYVYINSSSLKRYSSNELTFEQVTSEPGWFDLEGGVQKTINFINEAGQAGAKLVAFPEVCMCYARNNYILNIILKNRRDSWISLLDVEGYVPAVAPLAQEVSGELSCRRLRRDAANSPRCAGQPDVSKTKAPITAQHTNTHRQLRFDGLQRDRACDALPGPSTHLPHR